LWQLLARQYQSCNPLSEEVQLMNLKAKIILSSLPLYLLTLAALHTSVSNVLVSGFSKVEISEAIKTLQTAYNLLENDKADLTAILTDWAHWDDTYRFIADHNNKYIKENIYPTTFENLRLSVMAFVDSSGKTVLSYNYNPTTQQLEPISEGLRNLIQPNSPLLGDKNLAGIVTLPEGLMLVASSPILRSDNSGPKRGNLIFGRYITSSEVRRLSKLAHLDLAIRRYTNEKSSSTQTGKILKVDNRHLLTIVNNEVKIGSMILPDIYGKPAAVLKVKMDRKVNQIGLTTLRIVDTMIVLFALASAVVAYTYVDRTLVRRLTKLEREVQAIDVEGELKERVTVLGKDELGKVASSINKFLDNLETSHSRFHAMLSAMPDMFLLLTEDGKIVECHIPYREFTPFSREYLIGKRLTDILDASLASRALLVIQAAKTQGEIQTLEYELPLSNRKLYREARVVATSNGHYLALIRDITHQKEAGKIINMQIAAINAASDQIVITDAEGRIEYVNPAFELETGYTLDEVQGSRWHVFGTGTNDSYTTEQIWEHVTAGNTWRGELTGQRKDGTVYAEDVMITPVTDADGTITHYIAIKRDVTELKLYEAKLDQLAHHDPLTGLPNRLLFSDKLSQNLAHASRDGKLMALVFLDLDRFKLVNDTLGHTAGDQLLRQVAQRISATIRQVDTVARMGGDEFILILPDLKTPDDARKTACRVLEILSKPFNVMGHVLYITASIGISIFPSDGRDVESLVRAADTAMYAAKEQGRNTFRFYSEAMNTKAVERMTLENHLRRALESEDELILYYQPRVDVWTSRILGVEALVRWKHPEIGLITPDQFIPLAEETGIIVPLGEWIMRTACMQAKAWQEIGLPRVNMGINISAVQIHQSDFVKTVEQILNETGMNPELIDVELTESALVPNPELATRVLNQLKKKGVHVFIDDFGTGYSSLSHLKRFPVDAVKIDRSFIKSILTQADDLAIASAIIAMAHNLKLEVIAEGVETLEQLNLLRNLGCDQVQGYFISEPAPAEKLIDQLQRSKFIIESTTHQVLPYDWAA
jgi:diguanylate cyclase (GGDEF)-like protein/PAS domain S-box-containing protein